MGMYRWAVYFLKEWDVRCDHVHGFNMDEWSDRDGDDPARRPPRRLPERDAGGLLRPARRRGPSPSRSAGSPRPTGCPHYAERIAELKAKGAELIVIFGIGRVCHIAFWEPHFAAEFAERRRMEGPDPPARRPAPPADDRAERPDQLQEPDDARPRLRQHDRPGPVPPGRPDHRRRRRRLRPRHAVAGDEPLDDPPLRPRPLGPQLVHAHPARPALLPRRAGRPARARDELKGPVPHRGLIAVACLFEGCLPRSSFSPGG